MVPITADDALRRLLAEGRVRAAATDRAHLRLWDALAAATEGGKRFRPALVTATHKALGGTRPLAAVEVGAAVELLHTAFVIHDDVVDGDDVRRGRLNVSGTYKAGALAAGLAPDEALTMGRTAGILAGDLALAAAVRAVATCGAPADVVHRLLDLFDEALHTTAAGELADVRLSLGLGDPSVSESLTMEEQKTSAYSFALPMRAGALLAGADEAKVGRLGEAGRLLGIAFQLADDLLGVFGDPGRTGKSSTNDLHTSKRTPLLAHATSTAEWERIRALVGRDLTDDELTEVRRLLTVSGSRRFVEELADRHLTAARTIIEQLGVSTELLAAVPTGHPTLLAGKEVPA